MAGIWFAMRRRTAMFGAARRGSIGVYVGLAMPMLGGIAALAVDASTAHIRASQLQIAADAGALAGSRALHNGGNVQAEAIALANANIPAALLSVNAGTGVLSAPDVTTGTFAAAAGGAPTFTAGATPANAVRTITRMTAANGNPVTYSFAQILGLTSKDLTATSIAVSTSTCSTTPIAWQQPNILPTTTRIVTLGNFDGVAGTPTHMMTPTGNPIVRIDNSFDGPAEIVIRSNNRGNFTFNVPSRGQFFTLVPTIATGAPGSVSIVFRVHSSPGAKSGGTATWSNNLRQATPDQIVGAPICATGGTRIIAKMRN